MNLVQINEHLKESPLQALMSYANGQNPMVPAYMATGELKRREIMAQKQTQSQQAAQGQQPTVKEQVEQKAGLMALQAQQQKQAQQQLMERAQAQPMPVPPQTPQPEIQPEEESAFSYGGIARLPVNYDFASGGIIAFKEGDKVPAPEESVEEKKRRVMRLLTQGLPSTQGTAPPENKPLVASKEDAPAGLPSLMGPPEPPKPALRPGEAEIPGLYDTKARDIVNERLTPRTLESIAEAQAKADKLAGVEGKYGEAQMKRYGEEDAQYQQMLKDREFNRMLAVLSGMSRGGLGGAAPAYLQTQAAEQSADIAQKRRMNELYGNVEAEQRKEALAKSKNISTPYEAGVLQAGELAGKLTTSQMASQTEFIKEAASHKNALDRLDIQYKRDLAAAELKNLNDQELRRIENNYALRRDEINRKAQMDLERFRQSAPPEEQKNINAYLARWKKDPANKNKPETEGVTQYFADRLGGQFKENKTDVTGLNQLLESYQKQLEDITLPEPEKARIRALVVKTQNDLREAIARGRQGGLPNPADDNVVDFEGLK
jgi:hypothetical protein